MTDDTFESIYAELRRLAARRMTNESPGQTLQATALVHEAWLRLGGDAQAQWKSRAHFFGAAAETMRRILIDKARRKAALKRGGNVPSEDILASRLEISAPPDEILAVNDALDELAAHEPAAAQVVKLRYFVGMTVPEVAESLEISVSTVERHWTYARAWLKAAMQSSR